MSSENSTDNDLNDRNIVLHEELPGVTRWIKNCFLSGKPLGSGYTGNFLSLYIHSLIIIYSSD